MLRGEADKLLRVIWGNRPKQPGHSQVIWTVPDVIDNSIEVGSEVGEIQGLVTQKAVRVL